MSQVFDRLVARWFSASGLQMSLSILFLLYFLFRVDFWIFMMFHFIPFIFSSFIDFLPPPYLRILAAPFPDFHGFSPSPLLSRLDKPALLFRF